MKPPIHSVDGTFTHPDMYASPIGALQASTANLVRSAVDPRLLRRQSHTNKSPPTKSQTKGTGHKTLVSCVHTYTHTQAVMFTSPPPKGCFPKASVSATWHFKKPLHVQGLIHVLTEQEVMAWMGSNLSAAARLARGYLRCSTFSSSQ